VAVKGLQKPRNLREAAIVERELKRGYPQMYREDWPANKKKKKKSRDTKRTEQVKSGLQSAGLSDAEIKRLLGRGG
jgi:hypothetical protein